MTEKKNYNTINYERDKDDPRIAWIILNRPDKMNAITIGPEEMTGELIDAIRTVDEDQGVKVVIIKGKGNNFSAGFDLSMVYRVYGGKPGFRPHQSERLRIDEDQLLKSPPSQFRDGIKKHPEDTDGGQTGKDHSHGTDQEIVPVLHPGFDVLRFDEEIDAEVVF